MSPNLRPNSFWLKVRTRISQPSICVPTFTQFTKKGDDPELDQLLEDHKVLKPAERTLFAQPGTSATDPQAYTAPSVKTLAEAEQRGMVQLDKEQMQHYSNAGVVAEKLDRVEKTLSRIERQIPDLQGTPGTSGLVGRAREAALFGWIRANQSNVLVRQLAADLAEVNKSYGIMVTNLKGRPSERILHDVEANLPSIDSRLFDASKISLTNPATWLSLFTTGKLPDSPGSIHGQLAMMTDMSRTIQEELMVQRGMPRAVAEARRDARLEAVARQVDAAGDPTLAVQVAPGEPTLKPPRTLGELLFGTGQVAH